MSSDLNFYVSQNRLSGFYVISISETQQREAEEGSDGETIPVKQITLLKLSQSQNYSDQFYFNNLQLPQSSRLHLKSLVPLAAEVKKIKQ